MRDAVLAGPTPAEIIALVRLAEHGASIPPHLSMSVLAKGWVMVADDGSALLTIEGRALVDRAQTVDLEVFAAVPTDLATWSATQAA